MAEEVEALKAALRKEKDELMREAKEVLRAKWVKLLDVLREIEQQLAELEVLE